MGDVVISLTGGEYLQKKIIVAPIYSAHYSESTHVIIVFSLNINLKHFPINIIIFVA